MGDSIRDLSAASGSIEPAVLKQSLMNVAHTARQG